MLTVWKIVRRYISGVFSKLPRRKNPIYGQERFIAIFKQIIHRQIKNTKATVNAVQKRQRRYDRNLQVHARQIYIKLSIYQCRRHLKKLKKGRFHTNVVRKHFFSERVINLWNILPHQFVGAPTITAFKNRLDRHWKTYQYSLDSIPTTPVTFIRDNQEESNETIV